MNDPTTQPEVPAPSLDEPADKPPLMNRIAFGLVVILGFSLSLGQSAAHIIFSITGLSVIFSKPKLKDLLFPGLIILILFTLWQIIASFFGTHPRNIFSESGLIYQWLIMPVLLVTLSPNRQPNRFCKAFFISITASAILCVLQFFIGMDPTDGPFRLSPSGATHEHAHAFQSRSWVAAYIFGIGFIWLLIQIQHQSEQNKKKNIAFLFAVACITGLLLTGSRTMLLVTSLTAVAWSFIAVNKVIHRLIAMTLTIFFLTSGLAIYWATYGMPLKQGSSVGFRTYIWRPSLHVLSQNPVFGVGKTDFKTEFHLSWDYVYKDAVFPNDEVGMILYFRNAVGHPHQDYLALACYHGLPALALFLAFYARMFMLSFQYRHSAPSSSKGIFLLCLFSMLTGLTENYVDYTIPSYLFFSGLAIEIARARQRIDGASHQNTIGCCKRPDQVNQLTN